MVILVIEGYRFLNESHPGEFNQSEYRNFTTAEDVIHFIQNNLYIVFILGNMNEPQVALICKSPEEQEEVANELIEWVTMSGDNVTIKKVI